MDSYEVFERVGNGAFGVVHRCKNKNNNRLCVMKKIYVDSTADEDYKATETEVRVLSSLRHPNIIGYYESFMDNNMMIIIMEYASEGNLYDYLQNRSKWGLLQEEVVLRLFCQLVLGIRHIHDRQILHRDLKSHNVMLDKNLIVKIGDFGIAKILSSKSKANTVVGTPCYLSPELCEGKPYNQKSDMWALGCILYEMLTLKRAFEAQTVPALVSKIMRGDVAPISDRYSQGLRKLAALLLSLNPMKRPSIEQTIGSPIIFPTLFQLHLDLGMVEGH